MTRQKAELNKTNAKQTPTKFLDRIPIAGLHNCLHANDKREKHFWAVVLIIAAAITLYYFIPCIMSFVQFQTVVEMRHVTEQSIPFPSVYIGTGDVLNITYFVQIWLKVLDKLAADSRLQQLTRWFTRKNMNLSVPDLVGRALSYSIHAPLFEPWFGKDEPPIYNEVIYRAITAYGEEWIGLSNVYENIVYRCDMLFSICKFNNVPFSCCEKSQVFMMSTNIWYKPDVLAVASNAERNISMNGVPSLTIQTRFLPRAMLSERGVIGVGMGISIGHTAPSLFDAVKTIPGGTKAFIRITRKRRQLMNGCISHFRYDSKIHGQHHPDMQRYWHEMTETGNYSPNKCLVALLLEQIYSYCGCVPYYDTMKPNDTSICTPAHIYICFTLGMQGGLSVDDGSTRSRTKEIFKRLKVIETKTQRCLPLCDTWYYDAEITFASLNESDEMIIRNELVITVDPEYRLESDVLKINLISFYATLGDGLALFLGVSVVTFIQVAVWGTAAWLLARNRRRNAPAAESALAVAGIVIKHKIPRSRRVTHTTQLSA